MLLWHYIFRNHSSSFFLLINCHLMFYYFSKNNWPGELVWGLSPWRKREDKSHIAWFMCSALWLKYFTLFQINGPLKKFRQGLFPGQKSSAEIWRGSSVIWFLKSVVTEQWSDSSAVLISNIFSLSYFVFRSVMSKSNCHKLSEGRSNNSLILY